VISIWKQQELEPYQIIKNDMIKINVKKKKKNFDSFKKKKKKKWDLSKTTKKMNSIQFLFHYYRMVIESIV